MTKFKKNTHLSLSLYLWIYRKYTKCRTKADAHNKICFQYISISVDIVWSHARIQRVGQGVRTPPPPPQHTHTHLKNHKNIEFLSNTGPDPLKFSKTTKPAFNVGSSSACQRNAILRRFAGGPMMARFLWYLDPLSLKKEEKNVVRVRIQIRSEWNSGKNVSSI